MYEKAKAIGKILASRASDLDISETHYLEAKKRYEAVGDWFSRKGSSLAQYKPEIYPQGSFRLGTVVKPISNKDEYDIDLVCYLPVLQKEHTTQANLKAIVGDCLKENETYKRILDKEGRRCWTLNYANEFHMDILPSISDNEMRAKNALYRDALLITDRKKIENGDPDWPKSNPKGYADWFFGQQADIFQSMKKGLAEILKASVEDVPDYKVKTPLQRAIQVLKRHRDIFFSSNDGKNKPASIIITTLLARLYTGQDNVFNAIYDILQGIDQNMLMKNGVYYIPNPVNLEENFADRWNEEPALPRAFFNWINAAKDDFCNKALFKRDDMEIGKTLNESLGFSVEKKASQDVKIAPVYVKTSSQKSSQPWKDE